jgi:hypothetical protein
LSDIDDDDLLAHRGPGIIALVMPFATAIGALVIGGLAGGVMGWMLKPGELIEVPRDLTLDEIEAMCSPTVMEKTKELDQANDRISVLQAQVADRTQKVETLETEMGRRAEAGRSMSRELEAAKAELASVKLELEQVREEKVQLEIELADTVEKLEETEEALDDQIEATDRAQEDALTNKWYRFLNDTQLEICERGNRKKLGRCRETVLEQVSIEQRRDRFAHCVRSKQATPSVHELQKDEQMPTFAKYINQDERVVKDWYVQWCDPTLPEADGEIGEDHLPPTDDGSRDDMWDFDDLDDDL